MLADFYLNGAIATTWSLLNVTAEFLCNNMKPKADSQYRQPEIEIFEGVACSFYCGAPSENDPSAFTGNLFRRDRIGDHGYINFQIP
jgi:hypothetical protein